MTTKQNSGQLYVVMHHATDILFNIKIRRTEVHSPIINSVRTLIYEGNSDA